ncbi:MAG: hypothetical protein J6Q30_03190, partial [Oscillospiraceae bacterium]|nr:hypothetical protein [Oscillospiraceae bacterium]
MKKAKASMRLLFVLMMLVLLLAVSAFGVSAAETQTDGAVTGPASVSVEEISAQKAVSQYIYVDGDKVTISGTVHVTSGADDVLIFTDSYGSSVEYIVSDGALEIVGVDAMAELVLGISSNQALQQLTIQVATVSAEGTAQFNIPNADIEITAQSVLFEANQKTVLSAKSLSIQLSDPMQVELAVAKLGAKRLTASFENFDIQLSGSFVIEAEITESSIVDETENVNWGDEAEELLNVLDGSTKYLASVRPIYINVPIADSNITASSVLVDTAVEIKMNTKTADIPVAGNVAVLHSKIHISGASRLISAGDITIQSKNALEAEAAAAATDSLSYAIALSVINQMSQVTITDDSYLEAQGNITLQAQNDIQSAVKANGSEDSQDKSGVYATVSVVTQSTAAQILGNASVNAGGDLVIQTIENTNAETDAVSGAPEEEEAPSEEKEKKQISVSDILKLLKKLVVEDENGEEKPAVSEEDTKKVAEKLDEAAEAAKEEEKVETEKAPEKGTVMITVVDSADKPVKDASVKLSMEGKDDVIVKTDEKGVATFTDVAEGAYTITLSDGVPKGNAIPKAHEFKQSKEEGYAAKIKLSEKASESQFVGSVGIVVGVTDNKVVVNTTGNILVSGLLDIQAKSNVKYATNADASANSEASKSIGTAVVVQVVDAETIAKVSNGTITAGNVSIVAESGSEEGHGGSEATAKAGFSAGDFGLGGAIAVNVYAAQTRAVLEQVALETAGDITISAMDYSDTVTQGTAGCEQGTELEKESVGVGAGIAIAVNANTVEAVMGSKVQLTAESIGDLSVTAGSEGDTLVSATAGAAGGTSVAPVIALDVTDITVDAQIGYEEAALVTTGDITIQAGSKRKNKATTDASAAGSKVAVGAAISIGVVNVDTVAVSDRVIANANNVTISAVSANAAESTATAGANGAKADEEGDSTAPAAEEEEKDGDTTKSINKVLQAGNKLAGDKADCPEETPQKAETSEGQVSIGAAISLVVAEGDTESVLNRNLTASGDVVILTGTEKDLTVNADASATNSDTGVGVAVGILVANSNNYLTVS